MQAILKWEIQAARPIQAMEALVKTLAARIYFACLKPLRVQVATAVRLPSPAQRYRSGSNGRS